MRYSLEQLVHVLRNSDRCNPDASRQMVEKIFNRNAPNLLSKGKVDSFCQLLWESILYNESRVKHWVFEISESFWENVAVNASPSDAFHLLLSLWQANKKLGTRVTQAVGRQRLHAPEIRNDSKAMPLLGLCTFCGLESQISFPLLLEEIDKLYINPIYPRLACSLFYLQHSKPEIVPSFIKAMLTLERITFKVTLLLAEHPLPWTNAILSEFLFPAKNEDRENRDGADDRIILLFVSISRKVIHLNTMLNEICAPQYAGYRASTLGIEGTTKQEDLRSRSWAIIRLSKAIEKGIFTVQETEHPVTHRISRFLNLNWNHPQVTFALDITRDLLLALHDAQGDNEWVGCDVWDTAILKGRWKEEPLSPQQLHYWKECLLAMDAITVDYQQADDGRWIVTFSVNGNHPLVKSLIA